MSGKSKVVHLSQVRSHDNGTLQPRLPLPLIKLRDELAEQIRQLLRPVFENADDALFELAERAESNQGQGRFFDAMRELRLKRQRLEMAFIQGYSEAFKNLTAMPERRTQAPEISLESLSLVQNDELEERVAVESMVSKAKNRFSMELEHLTLRMESLLGNQRLSDDRNPLGPQVLGEAFAAACGELEVDIEAKLVVLKLFDKFVLSNLQGIYERANSSLIALGVMPDLKSVRPARKAYSNPNPANRAAPVTVDGHTGQPVADTGGAEVFGLLRELMAEHRGQAGTLTSGGLADPAGLAGTPNANLPVLSQVELMSLLSTAQQRFDTTDGNQVSAANNGLIDMGALLQTLMQGQLQPARLNQMDEDVINLVSMLFEFILNDNQLPATMKALIARLQIPMLKVAIMDKSFFGKEGHPARRLLNEIANAAIGWNEKPENEPDPLRDKVEAIVHQLLNDFDDNLQVFDDILADFQTFVQAEQRRRQLVEQRVRDAEEGRAKAELARREVQQTLEGLTAGRRLPEVALKLLRDAWSNVLVLLHLKHGTESEEWNRAVRLAQDLVWSVNPPEEPEARRQLLQMIPMLVKGIREGLAATSFNPFELDKLLKELEACHLVVLRRLSAKKAPSAPAAPERAEPAPAKQAPQALAKPQEAEPATPGVKAPAAEVATSAAERASVAEEEASATEGKTVAADRTPDLVAGRGETPTASAVEGMSAFQEKAAPVDTVTPEQAVVSEANITAAETEAAASAEVEPKCLQQVDNLRVGSWVEFHEDVDKKFRAKLAAIIRATGKYIFVNRTGVKVAEKTREGLAMALRAGHISLLDDGLLFDRALEAVIGNLRNSQRA